MGHLRPPTRAKLFVGLLAGDLDLLHEAARRLEKELGRIDAASLRWPFTGTDYYRDELGPDIHRQFVSIEALFAIERLPEIKRLTNDLELRMCDDLALDHDRRPVNLDPGYLTLSKVVLATTKDFSHRLYLSQGIYAEVTLHYESARWHAWPWTYPDYAATTYHPWFQTLRERLKEQLRDDGK